MAGIVQDQRVEPRFSSFTPTPALMRLLDDGGGGAPRPAQPVEVVNLSGSGLRIRASQSQATGTLVRVDCQDVMLLGEVCYCEPEGSQFAMGIRLEHSLVHTDSLERLRQRFADEETGWSRRDA
jgi:PilZ domain